MTQRRELAGHAAPVNAVREQRIEEVAHILPPGLTHGALAFATNSAYCSRSER